MDGSGCRLLIWNRIQDKNSIWIRNTVLLIFVSYSTRKGAAVLAFVYYYLVTKAKVVATVFFGGGGQYFILVVLKETVEFNRF